MPPRRTRRRATLTAAALVVSSLFVAPGIMWGTIEEQRARLPPPADCADPVDGVWLGIEDDAARNNWYEFTLVIHRPDPRKSELVGEVVSHAWSGGKEVKEPPPCAPGRFEHMVHMPADGTVTGNRLYFGGKSVKTDDVLCGSQLPYYPDKFTGTVDTVERHQRAHHRPAAGADPRRHGRRALGCRLLRRDPGREGRAVHVEMYLLTNATYITNALIDLAKSGLDVKVILNQTFPSGTSSSDTNASSYTQLQGSPA
jgi:hypothetical protein